MNTLSGGLWLPTWALLALNPPPRADAKCIHAGLRYSHEPSSWNLHFTIPFLLCILPFTVVPAAVVPYAAEALQLVWYYYLFYLSFSRRGIAG
jgi:hypothetical protein